MTPKRLAHSIWRQPKSLRLGRLIDQDEAAVNETSLDEGVELPDENALPTAKQRSMARSGITPGVGFRSGSRWNSSEDSEFTIVSSRSPSRGSMRSIGI